MFSNASDSVNLPLQVTGTPPKRLGDLLIEAGYLTDAQLEATLRQQQQLSSIGRPVRLGELLVRNHFTTAQQIKEIMEGEAAASASSAVSEFILSPSTCSKYRVIPVSLSNRVLTIKSARALREGDRTAIMSAATSQVDKLRVMCADLHEMHTFLTTQVAHESFSGMLDRLRANEQGVALVKNAIDALLHEAIDMRVSDIHIDVKPEPDAFISLRVDGELQQSYILRERMMASLSSRIKTLAGMDASNTRAPQDGRIEMAHRGRMVGFRVASQPLVDGETVTIRVIDAAALPTAEALFPSQPVMMRLLRNISKVHGKSGGLMLVTGPTGSGKSTTQYTMAAMLHRDRINVITVENPVEYKLPFARQIQLQDLLDQKATDLERSVLRQDPDVLILGEIRDGASATAALKFAESGHFVLSTLHSQSAGGTMDRLISMLPESGRHEASFVLASTLKSVINQRLFKRLCDCSIGIEDDTEFDEVRERAHDIEELIGQPLSRNLRKTQGCHRCRYTGYRGRVTIHETLIFSGLEQHREAFANALVQRRPISELQATGCVKIIRSAETVDILLRHGHIDLEVARMALGLLEDLNRQGTFSAEVIDA